MGKLVVKNRYIEEEGLKERLDLKCPLI